MTVYSAWLQTLYEQPLTSEDNSCFISYRLVKLNAIFKRISCFYRIRGTTVAGSVKQTTFFSEYFDGDGRRESVMQWRIMFVIVKWFDTR